MNPLHPEAATVPPLVTRPFSFAECLHTPPMLQRYSAASEAPMQPASLGWHSRSLAQATEAVQWTAVGMSTTSAPSLLTSTRSANASAPTRIVSPGPPGMWPVNAPPATMHASVASAAPGPASAPANDETDANRDDEKANPFKEETEPADDVVWNRVVAEISPHRERRARRGQPACLRGSAGRARTGTPLPARAQRCRRSRTGRRPPWNRRPATHARTARVRRPQARVPPPHPSRTPPGMQARTAASTRARQAPRTRHQAGPARAHRVSTPLPSLTRSGGSDCARSRPAIPLRRATPSPERNPAHVTFPNWCTRAFCPSG